MANTKVTGDLIASSTIATGNIADNAVTSDKISGITTAHITEGSNLYYTDARSRGAISVSGNALSYNSSTGVITSNFEEAPTFTGIVTASRYVATGQNLSHGASRLKISQENTTLSEIRFYGADTSTAGALRFMGSSSDGSTGDVRMTIASSGNVGIGTTSPGNKFHIEDGAGGGNPTDSRTKLYINSSGEAYMSINIPTNSFGGIRLAAAGTNKAFFELYDNTAQGQKLSLGTIDARDVVINTSNTERMRITSAGALEIGGTATAGANKNAFITNTDSLTTIGSTQSSGTPKDMAFWNGAERMRIQATTGNVGIGTTSPQSKLHLNGDLTTPGSFSATTYQPAWSPTTSVWLKNSWTSGPGDYLYIASTGNQYQTASTAISLTDAYGMLIGRGKDSVDGTLSTEWMRIASSGVTTITRSPFFPAATLDDVTTLNLKNESQSFGGSAAGIQLNAGDGDTIGSIFSRADGNDNTTEALFITTNTDNPIIFGTNTGTTNVTSNERMRITEGGNVGIGATSPATKLQVANAGEVIVRSSMTAADGYRGGFEADNQHTGGTIWSMFSTNNSDGFFGGGKYVIANESMGGVDANTTAKFVIDGSGNVGIGPQSNGTLNNKLQVSTGVDGDGIILTGIGDNTGIANGSYRKIGFRYDDTDGSFESEIRFVVTNSGVHGGQMEFFTDNTSGVKTRAITIDNAQRVGIGTTSPSAKLHVENTNAAIVYVKSTVNNQNASIWFNSNSSGTQADRWEIGTNISAGTDLEFFDRLNSVSRMVIQNDGNVGIGTISPGRKLDVSGEITHEGLVPKAGAFVDGLVTINKTVSISANTWTSLDISLSNIGGSGTFAVQVYSNAHGSTGGAWYNMYWSGIMSWFHSNVNDNDIDEIPLHMAGHARNNNTLELRTKLHTNDGSSYANRCELQIKTANALSSAPISFRFRKLL